VPAYLYWDESDAADPNTEKLRRAIFDSVEEAQAQAEADLAHGRNLVCIETSDVPLGLTEVAASGVNVVTFERGFVVVDF
jgi:hypothetical protein